MSVLSTDLLKFRYTSGDTISYASVVGGSPTAAGPPAGWASPAYPYGAGSGSSYSPSTSSRGSPRTPSYFPFPPPSPTSTASAAPPPPPPPSSDPSGGAPVDVEGSVEGWATDGSMAPSRTPQSSTGSVDPTAASSWTYPPHAAYPGYSGYGYPPATYTDYAAWQQYTAAMAQASYVTCKICADVCVCTSEEMSLPEVQIGAVFGKGGAGLKWLQSSTGTRVVVSSRRAVSPDTPFRSVPLLSACVALCECAWPYAVCVCVCPAAGR